MALSGRLRAGRGRRQGGYLPDLPGVNAGRATRDEAERLIQELAPDAPPALIIDRNEMAAIEESLERIFAFHRSAGAEPVGAGSKALILIRFYVL